MARPQPGEYAEYYQRYIDKAEGADINAVMAKYSNDLNHFVNNLPASKAEHKYAEDKWTVKDLLQHIIDAERIFTYRALRFARKDQTLLPGFEENDYAANANTSARSLQELKDEFVAVRKSTDLFLSSLNEEQLQQTGKANNHSITVNAIAFIIFGHIIHHKGVLEERYL